MLKVGDKVIRSNKERSAVWRDFCRVRSIDPVGTYVVTYVDPDTLVMHLQGFTMVGTGSSLNLNKSYFLKVKG